jgi:hypothetical protein
MDLTPYSQNGPLDVRQLDGGDLLRSAMGKTGEAAMATHDTVQGRVVVRSLRRPNFAVDVGTKNTGRIGGNTDLVVEYEKGFRN